MGNYIYCGDKIFIQTGLVKKEYVSLDDESMTKIVLNDSYLDAFNEIYTVYDVGQEAFELREYDTKNGIIELGFSNELIRSLKREFQELSEFNIENKEEYIIEHVKTRKRGM